MGEVAKCNGNNNLRGHAARMGREGGKCKERGRCLGGGKGWTRGLRSKTEDTLTTNIAMQPLPFMAKRCGEAARELDRDLLWPDDVAEGPPAKRDGAQGRGVGQDRDPHRRVLREGPRCLERPPIAWKPPISSMKYSPSSLFERSGSFRM